MLWAESLDNTARNDTRLMLYDSCSSCTANNVQFILAVDLDTSDRYPDGYPEE